MVLNRNVCYRRKTLVTLCILCGATMTLHAGASDESSSSNTAETASPGIYHEAPMLAELVAAGELPPVYERLPASPVMLNNHRNAAPDGLLRDMLEIGEYGGTLYLCSYYGDARFETRCLNAEPPLARPGWISLAHPLTENILDHYKSSPDGRTYTLHIRDGLKWSDGIPVTTGDVQFNYEDILNNKDITGEKWPHGWTSPIEEKYELQIVDELTFKIEFENSTPGFLDVINMPWVDYTHFIQPKHFLQRFHADYNDRDNLDAVVRQEDAEDWVEIFQRKRFILGEPPTKDLLDVPVLHPWKVVEVKAGKWTVLERNPYYFKTDAMGNQLPYIDRVVVNVVDNEEICDVKAFSGEIDLYGTSIPKLPRAKEYAESGDYRVEVSEYGYLYHPLVHAFNFTFGDEVWQTIVADVRFRKALNLSINREEIVSAFYYDLSDLLPKWVPSTYDPGEAERLLDEIGLDQRDRDGWRLRPDGELLRLSIMVSTTDLQSKVHEWVAKNYRAVGVNTKIVSVDRSRHAELRRTNQLKIDTTPNASTVLYTLGRASDQLLRPNPLWKAWYHSDGEAGLEPPKWFKTLYELARTIGPGNQLDENNWYDSLGRYHKYFVDTIPQINITYNPPVLMIRKNNLGNVFSGGPTEWVLYSSEQLYKDTTGQQRPISQRRADPIAKIGG